MMTVLFKNSFTMSADSCFLLEFSYNASGDVDFHNWKAKMAMTVDEGNK